MGIYHHVGIYLGNNEVCHLSGNNQGVKITSWQDFLKEGTGNIVIPQEIIRFHPIIPFKNYQEIAEQIG